MVKVDNTDPGPEEFSTVPPLTVAYLDGMDDVQEWWQFRCPCCGERESTSAPGLEHYHFICSCGHSIFVKADAR